MRTQMDMRWRRTSSSRKSSPLVVRSHKHSVFFSGDTGLTNDYTAMHEHFAKFDQVMPDVGAFHPSSGDLHLGPERALEALARLGGGVFLPLHRGMFSLALHDWDAPGEMLLGFGPKQGMQLVMARLGEAVEPACVETLTPW